LKEKEENAQKKKKNAPKKSEFSLCCCQFQRSFQAHAHIRTSDRPQGNFPRNYAARVIRER
jgi:hypothetical protein